MKTKKKKSLKVKFRLNNYLRWVNDSDGYGQVSFLPRLDLFWANNVCLSFGWFHLDFQIWIGRELDDLLGSDSFFI